MSDIVIAIILGIVEGATEFLPVSSTGHLIVASDLMGLEGENVATFNIFIQLGAILAVVWDRRNTLFHGEVPLPRLAFLLLVAFLPAAVIGLLADDAIEHYLFSSKVVAYSLIAGAIAILIIEGSHLSPRRETLSSLTWRDALGIGLAQCAAFVPGVSRAMATILGGMMIGLKRPLATEFSFLLAIPTIGAASMYKLLSSTDTLSTADIPFFATGFVVSFIVALLVVRWLIGFVRSHDFRAFAVWRIAVGVIILWFGIGEDDPAPTDMSTADTP